MGVAAWNEAVSSIFWSPVSWKLRILTSPELTPHSNLCVVSCGFRLRVLLPSFGNLGFGESVVSASLQLPWLLRAAEKSAFDSEAGK